MQDDLNLVRNLTMENFTMIRRSVYLNVAISTRNRNVREHNIPLATV